jgi:hypothetical protein
MQLWPARFSRAHPWLASLASKSVKPLLARYEVLDEALRENFPGPSETAAPAKFEGEGDNFSHDD